MKVFLALSEALVRRDPKVAVADPLSAKLPIARHFQKKL